MSMKERYMLLSILPTVTVCTTNDSSSIEKERKGTIRKGKERDVKGGIRLKR